MEHPNIVRATDAGEEDGLPFLVMEYVNGADLSTIVKANGPLSVADSCELIRQTAIGLQFAHDQQLIHRDVKPSNLIVAKAAKAESNGHASNAIVKILDLGLARLMDDESSQTDTSASVELTQEGLILGTVDYMSPEQVLSLSESDARSDTYSLGCTFYFLLT